MGEESVRNRRGASGGREASPLIHAAEALSTAVNAVPSSCWAERRAEHTPLLLAEAHAAVPRRANCWCTFCSIQSLSLVPAAQPANRAHSSPLR